MDQEDPEQVEEPLLGDEEYLFLTPDIEAVDVEVTAEDTEDTALVTPITPEVSLPCLLYTSPSPRDLSTSRMPSSA